MAPRNEENEESYASDDNAANASEKNRSSTSNTSDNKSSTEDETTASAAVATPIPVTILSGFLGSGKTTLLKYILTSKEHSLKIAVIVNDMAELNIDGQTIRSIGSSATSTTNNSEKQEQQIIQTKREIVTLENGCICCTLRGDLIREIHRIQQLNQFDYVLIESTGIAEPQQVAESFCVDPETLELAAEDDSTLGNMSARLDTCVTVVDVVNFPRYMSSLQRFQDVFQDGLDPVDEQEEGKKSISELMVEQVEFANVILLNKVDLVSPGKIDIAKKLVESLNPKARVVTGSYGKMDLTQLLNTNLFDMKEAQESPGWLVSLKDGVTASEGEADEYGVSSFVYRARTPFHPQRLHSFLQTLFCFAEDWQELVVVEDDHTNYNSNNKDEKGTQTKDHSNGKEPSSKYGSILRSKGTCWIAGRDDHAIGWAQTGRIVRLSHTGPWYCNTSQDNWYGVETEHDMERIQALFRETTTESKTGESSSLDHPYGDRRQEVVFIGTELKREAIEEALQCCLLTDVEMKSHTITALPIGAYPDPLEPILVLCDAAKSMFVIARMGQSQHIRVYPGFAFTISNLALNFVDMNHCQDVLAVKVWLDRSDVVERGILLATLRPVTLEQHALSLTLLPCDEGGGEEAVNRRVRVEVIFAKKLDGKQGCKKLQQQIMEAVEVHVMGKVESLQYDPQDEEYEDDEEMEAECDTGNCSGPTEHCSVDI